MTTPSDITRRVSLWLGVDMADVRDSGVRTRTVIRARRCIAYWLRVDRGCSWGEVARALGIGRNSARRLCRYSITNPDPEIASIMMGETQ